jgi:hypothetical protein
MKDMAEIDDNAMQPEPEAQAEQPETPEAGAETVADGDDEIVVTIGDETPAPEEDDRAAPEWVRKLRKDHREATRKIKELEAKLTAPVEKPADLGPRPLLQDFDYDEAKHADAVELWLDRKRQHDAEQAAKRAEQEAQEKAWQDRVTAYQGAKAALKARDFDEAEETVKETLSVTQQGIILQGAKDPALIVYALGKNPEKAKELAAIKDPVQFAFAVAKMEDKVKASPRKPASAPETPVMGNARPAGATDDKLAKLREQAERSGDWSDYFAAKRRSAKP